MAKAVTVAFFRSEIWYTRIIKWGTRRPGQSMSAVPTHCALITDDGILHEMVATGYNCRVATTEDYVWVYTVLIGNPEALIRFLANLKGTRYGFLTILEIALCRICPNKWFRYTRAQKQQDCSWLVKAALEEGTWPCPIWLRSQYQPVSPNDLLFALKDLI